MAASDLEQKIIYHLENLFGDYNFPRDIYLQHLVKENEGGWIPLDILVTFEELFDLSTDKKVITDAIAKSSRKLIEVSEDGENVRRSVDKPYQEFREREWNLLLWPINTSVPVENALEHVRGVFGIFGLDNTLSLDHYNDGNANVIHLKGVVNPSANTEENSAKFFGTLCHGYKIANLNVELCKTFVDQEE